MPLVSSIHRYPTMKLSGRFFLIDGSSFCYRAFYAIKNLSTSKGQPTNAVYGVISMLRKLIMEEQPEYLAVAFDLPKPTFRHIRYEGYKEHRRPMPEALVSQMPLIKEFFKVFKIPVFELEGYEADDVLGTLARRTSAEGIDVFLVTGDKDLLQLLSPKIKVYRPTQDGHEVVDEETLNKKWGLKPGQVVEVMALMGDDTDAIPGVPGIGEKTAVELIRKFGSVREMMDRFQEIPGEARRSAIEKYKDQMNLSRELAALDTEVPLELDFQSLRRREPDGEALYRLFQTLEFKALMKEFAPRSARKTLSVKAVSSEKEFRTLFPEILRAGRFALVIAKGEGHPMRAEVTAIGLSWAEGAACSLPADFPPRALRDLLSDPKLLKICPSLKETLVLLSRRGESISAPWNDPQLSSYLLDPARPSHEIPALAQEFLEETIDEEDPLQAAALEAEAALRLAPTLEREIADKEMVVLLNEVEIPLAEILARIETAGIAVDLKELEFLSKEMEGTLNGLIEEIRALAGGEAFNINSPKQLSQVLFERLKLPVIKKTKTGASTDEEVLKRLSLMHPLPAKILEYRETHKLRSTYVEALPKLVDPLTGRIHTSLNQTVTATGRLSSSNPNLQNIPIRTEAGRRIRRAFVSSGQGNLLLAADYSQIELRIMAHLSEDERLVKAFLEGEDIHKVTAAEMFHLKPEEISADQRAAAKTINFGIIYGMTPFGLAKELGISPPQAEEFIQSYFGRYPKVKVYLQKSLEESRQKGYCTTIFNRRRYIPELHSKDPVIRQFAERTAINAPIQGSAADLIKVAMVVLDRIMRKMGLRSVMILQVHDELIFDVPNEELEKMKGLVREAMESPTLSGKTVKLSVPIEVKLKTGRSWFEA